MLTHTDVHTPATFLLWFFLLLCRPENVPRLFDLIKVKDGKILPAFYYAVRDTLVAKDLEQATRIAYGKTRYRVVTLDGQLIDQSGMFCLFLKFINIMGLYEWLEFLKN